MTLHERHCPKMGHGKGEGQGCCESLVCERETRDVRVCVRSLRRKDRARQRELHASRTRVAVGSLEESKDVGTFPSFSLSSLHPVFHVSSTAAIKSICFAGNPLATRFPRIPRGRARSFPRGRGEAARLTSPAAIAPSIGFRTNDRFQGAREGGRWKFVASARPHLRGALLSVYSPSERCPCRRVRNNRETS